MAWTAPRTWVNGELVTDTLFNTHVRDNLNYLKGTAGVVTIDNGHKVSTGLGASQYEVNESSGSGQSGFLMTGEPGVTFDSALVSFNWKQLSGASIGRANTGKGASYIRMLANEIDFDLVTSGGTDTRMAYLTSIGLGIKRSSPQGILHTYNSISGFLLWEFDGLDATVRTIIPDGAGDVLYGLALSSVVRCSDGTVQAQQGFAGATWAPGTAPFIYTNGADSVTLTIAANGSVTVARSGGTKTYKVSLLMQWL